VIASNNDGIWNTEGAALKIIVLPPFWRTSWAYGFYVILILAMLYLFKKWILHEAKVKRKIELEELEIKKLHEMDTLKNQFFSNVSHEFRTPLTLIIGPLQKLLESSKNEAKKSQVKLVKEMLIDC
jgi:signal transduction histidine kinase